MSNQCRNCGRDVNNNYAPYTNAYGSKTGGSSSSSTGGGGGSGSGGNKSSCTKSDLSSSKASAVAAAGANASTSASVASVTNQITAKVMFGTVGAINELREKEQVEKNNAARAGRRQ